MTTMPHLEVLGNHICICSFHKRDQILICESVNALYNFRQWPCTDENDVVNVFMANEYFA